MFRGVARGGSNTPIHQRFGNFWIYWTFPLPTILGKEILIIDSSDSAKFALITRQNELTPPHSKRSSDAPVNILLELTVISSPGSLASTHTLIL